jgi:hypothetical protein
VDEPAGDVELVLVDDELADVPPGATPSGDVVDSA